MRILVMLLVLGACSDQAADQGRETAAPAAVPTAPTDAPVAQQAMVSVPNDPAELKKLAAMGYSVHDDHMHAPGVSSCPKMSDDPVM